MNAQNSLLQKGAPTVVAKVGAPFGLKGQLRLWSFTDPVDNVCDYHHWYIKRPKGPWHKLEGCRIDRMGQKLMIHFKGCDNPEQARQYTHALLGVDRGEFAPLESDECYWADVSGLRVINQQACQLGVVDYVLETPANPVLVVQSQGQNNPILIPWVKAYVLDINLDDEVIRVDWEATW